MDFATCSNESNIATSDKLHTNRGCSEQIINLGSFSLISSIKFRRTFEEHRLRILTCNKC